MSKPAKKNFNVGGTDRIRFANNLVATQSDYIDTATDMIGDTIDNDTVIQEGMVNNILINAGAKASSQVNKYKSEMKRKAMLKKTTERYYQKLNEEAAQQAEQERAEKNRLRNLKRRAKAKAKTKANNK